MLWRCPRCRGSLEPGPTTLACHGCAARYPMIGGIPDLRLPGSSWIDQDADRIAAAELAARTDASAADLIRAVFAARRGWTSTRIDSRTREVLTAPRQLQAQLDDWLSPVVSAPGVLLDIGCGPGMLLAAAAGRRERLAGIDVSLVWLVAAKRLIEEHSEHGGRADLAAALGEALPLADGSVGALVSLDVIEHVHDPGTYLREIDRVLQDKGVLALSTPNRFSLAAEPHVGVWGVGWLPRRWQKGYVRWRSGQPYESVALLSAGELQRLCATHTRCDCRVMAPAVPAHALAHFPPYRQRLARIYNALVASPLGERLIRRVGAFFRVIGVKDAVKRAVSGPRRS